MLDFLRSIHDNLFMTKTATVVNGKVEGTPTPNQQVKCDRCGREFPAKFIFCVCRG